MKPEIDKITRDWYHSHVTTDFNHLLNIYNNLPDKKRSHIYMPDRLRLVNDLTGKAITCINEEYYSIPKLELMTVKRAIAYITGEK